MGCRHLVWIVWILCAVVWITVWLIWVCTFITTLINLIPFGMPVQSNKMIIYIEILTKMCKMFRWDYMHGIARGGGECFDSMVFHSLRLFCALLSVILLALKVCITLKCFLHCFWLSPSSTSWIIYYTCLECTGPSPAAGHRAGSVGHQQLTGNVKAAIITTSHFRSSLWEGSRICLFIKQYIAIFVSIWHKCTFRVKSISHCKQINLWHRTRMQTTMQ